MLGRLISNFFGVPRKAAAASVAPPDRHSATDTLAKKVQQLCADGRLREAEKEITSQMATPLTADDAVVALQRVCVPALAACLQRNDAAVACDLEAQVYNHLIKRFEEPSHYQKCFAMMDDVLYRLGTSGARAVEGRLPGASERPVRLLFFVFNLATELAHITLLCDVIEAYLAVHPEQAENIGVVGVGGGSLAPRLKVLQKVRNVQLINLGVPTSHAALYLRVASLLDSEGYDRLVVAAVPLGLSFFTGLLPASRVCWLSMKFEPACFEHLFHRCSFTSGLRRARQIDGKHWLEAPPAFTKRQTLRASERPPTVLQEARRFRTVFYTINREAKIRNPVFLQTVVSILQQVPDSCFVWTGQERMADIDAFFNSRGMSKRHFFAGWIVPDDLILGGDIFLDTPVLSGSVAARTVACGRPVLSWSDAYSWINFFAEPLARDRLLKTNPPFQSRLDKLEAAGVSLECATASDYVAQAVMLAQSPALRDEYAQVLGGFAEHYFFNATGSAEDHFANFRSADMPLPTALTHPGLAGKHQAVVT